MAATERGIWLTTDSFLYGVGGYLGRFRRKHTKKIVWQTRQKWEDNIKMDVKKKGLELWTEFIPLRTGSQWRDLVNMG
jgi:uncharacterized membrane protein